MTTDDPYSIPIFIQNFNQVSYLRKLVNWLSNAGHRRLIVIDNASTYEPLLQYYEEMRSAGVITVFKRDTKDGKRALWNEGILDRFGVTGQFVYSSSDVVPDTCCPPNLVERLASILEEDAGLIKAGIGLRIDDLPDCYCFRPEVLLRQRRNWRAPAADGLFFARIDTTFALYRSPAPFAYAPAVRTGWPYLARHEPWYSDSANRTAEELYYADTIAPNRGAWGRHELPQHLLDDCAKIRAAGWPKLLHLACGRGTIPGWINLDADSGVGPDIVFDLENCAEQSLPIEAESVDGIFMCRGFECVVGTMAMMEELYRVAKPNTRFILRFRPSPGPPIWPRGRTT